MSYQLLHWDHAVVDEPYSNVDVLQSWCDQDVIHRKDAAGVVLFYDA